MSVVVTMVVALLGGVTLSWGWVRYLRGRFAGPGARGARSARSARRTGVVMTIVGGVLLLRPALVSHLVWPSAAASGVSAALGTLAAWVWTFAVLLGLLVVYGSMMLASERVTRPVAAAATRRWARIVGALPTQATRQAQRRRRHPDLADFPREWEELVAYHRVLSGRLLDYHRDLERSCDLPAMHDHAVPTTAAAWDAMLRCDALVPAKAPAAVPDVIATPYGRAVADFAVALADAEANARRLATEDISPQEREALADVEATAAFLRRNHTTAAERAAALEALRARLGDAVPDPGGPEPSSHPWLDVTQRTQP